MQVCTTRAARALLQPILSMQVEAGTWTTKCVGLVSGTWGCRELLQARVP